MRAEDQHAGIDGDDPNGQSAARGAGNLQHRIGSGVVQFERGGAKEFVRFLRVLFEAQDDEIEISESSGSFELRQKTWKLMADVGDYSPACNKVLQGLFEGLAAGCGRHIPVHQRPAAGGKPPFIWSIG